MSRKLIKIFFAVSIIVLMTSCKNTKQKLQEFVPAYNAGASGFKAPHVTLTTARGYLKDNKIELRFETDLEQNEANKKEAEKVFPDVMKELNLKNPAFKELVNEGVRFDLYYLAADNTVFIKEIVTKETVSEHLKE
ncbi:hypothetical protein [Flavobacterium foetidum]|uniref:hypothetical protein n=1 Tax=Flavobacterium foetidum TaxID=2026681 RepID=UPI0010750156|nr:hypothetical protein [Flavobacterium foetidum]KAF2517663.1 hypothetical protein E0W73_00210 [Flavobacterium foetidum]